MTINYNIFNNLNDLRYTMTVMVNGDEYKLGESFTGPVWKLEMKVTYKQLIEELRKIICKTESDSHLQQFRNHASTLNSFMTYVDKTEDSRVGAEMQSSFQETLSSYINYLTVSDRSKADRRSQLKKCQSTFNILTGNIKVQRPLQQFNLTLKQAMIEAGLSQSELILKANVSKSVLSQWIRGAKPNVRTLSSIHRVEDALRLKRDSLSSLVKENNSLHKVATPQKIKYRERLAYLAKRPYKLQENEISQALLEEWYAYFEYKTSECIYLKRTNKGVWRLKPILKHGKLPPQAYYESKCSVTAGIVWDQLIRFLGFLRLPKSENGFGLETKDVQTMAWFAHSQAIQKFLEFCENRADGLRNGSHKRFAVEVKSLTSPTTGYLWQQPEFYLKIPKQLRPEIFGNWSDMCAKSNEVAGRWKCTSKAISRSPEEPIAPLLALEYPLEPILRAIKQLDNEANSAPSGGVVQARLKRDALLLAFLISNPLRALNFKIMTWSADGTQHLYKTEDNKYRLKFAASEMKTNEVYDIKIAQWLVSRLQEYLEEFREVLLDGESSNYLLISSKKKSVKKMWWGMNSHVCKLTKRLIPECVGFSPHAFRNLVATDWLRKNPNDYITVAALLNDKLETVIKHYAHLKKDHSFERYENYMEKVIDENGYKI